VRILYLFPEEWTGRRAREIQTFQTCLALAEAGVEVCLVTAGGEDLGAQAQRLGRRVPTKFTGHRLSRRIGPITSVALYAWRLRRWLGRQPPFSHVYVIHLKAAQILLALQRPYWWEAHEIFAETPPPGSAWERRLSGIERRVIAHAAGRVATSQALADALNRRYFSTSLPFQVIPNAGDPPLGRSLADPEGPLVYAGSLGDWKGLPLVLDAAQDVGIPVRVVGGTRQEWERFVRHKLARGVARQLEWHPRVSPSQLPEMLRGCRAGVVPTLPDTGSGRYSCPMKLFDYARCGLPVVTTALPSLQSLAVGDWCRLVPSAGLQAWVGALRAPLTDGAAAMEWAASHTWSVRARQLRAAFGGG
jgi:glycosyltransferase involved in cell wall biosynthesis